MMRPRATAEWTGIPRALATKTRKVVHQPIVAKTGAKWCIEPDWKITANLS